MTALSADVQRPHRGVTQSLITKLPLAGYTNFAGGSVAFNCYKGTLILCDVSDTDGYFRPHNSEGAAVTVASGDVFGGVAVEYQQVTSSNTADGSVSISVARDGIWAFPIASNAQTDVGAAAYASDDNTITATSTNNLWVGVIVGVDSTYVYVDISTAAGRITSAA
jgi:hypothetical protein